MAEAAVPARYPVRLDVEYSEPRSRWKALLRLPLSVPVLIFSSLLQGGVTLGIWAAVLVGGRIPRWLFEFQVGVNRWQARAVSYLLLLTDEYPPFEGAYPVQYDVQYPERLSRWRLVIWKFITSIPHFIVLEVLALTLLVVVPIAWFAVLFTGRFPRGLHGYVAGILRWGARVQAYVLSLTDEFPPYSLSADAGPGGRRAYAGSSTFGLLAVGAVVGFFAALVILRLGDVVTDVSYERLLAGELRPGETRVQVDSAEDQLERTPTTGWVELAGAVDPADELQPLFVPAPGYRLVQFELRMKNESYDALWSDQSGFHVKDDDGRDHGDLVAVVDGRVAPWRVQRGETASAIVLFEIPDDTNPAELRFDIGHHVHRSVIYKFR